MARLILFVEGTSREFPLVAEASIGRASANTIYIREPKASRRHARVRREGADFVIEDLESANGTKVNGRPVDRFVLRHGDSIQIGETRLVFDEPERKDAPRPEASRPLLRRSYDDPLVGRTLGGCRILARVGRGGMGAVYEAIQLSLDRPVALKVLKRELADDLDFAREFLQEARTAGRLQHPGLVSIHGAGQEEGLLYYFMALIDGESVMARLTREGRLGVAETLAIARGVTETLVYLAAQDAVHQDVNPRNILLEAGGRIKLTDFGLATIGGLERYRGDANRVWGTPHYMAPEQASQKKAVGPWTDLYALGCTLYHMLTGKVPFDGPNGTLILAKHSNQARPDPRLLAPEIPEPLAALILELMAIDPAERPRGPGEVLARLKEIEAGLGTAVARERPSRARTAPARRVAAEAEGEGAEGEGAEGAGAEGEGAAGEGAEDEGAEGEGAEGTGAEGEGAESAVARARDSGAARIVRAGVLVVLFAVTFQLTRMAVVAFDPNAERRAVPAPRPAPPARPVKANEGPAPKLPPPDAAVAAKAVPPKEEKATKVPAVTPPDTDRAALEELQKVLEKRDTALQTGNFAAARAVLAQFQRQYRSGAAAGKAEEALAETERIIAEATAKLFQDAEQAAVAKDYRTAIAKCTRLLSSDPKSQSAPGARALMERMDQQAEPRSQAVSGAAAKALTASKLDEAIGLLTAGLDELGGTRWAEPLTAQQLQLVLAQQFLRECEKARQALGAKGQPISITVLGADGKPASAVLREINGLSLKTELRGVTLPASILQLAPEDWQAVVKALGLADRHLGLANFYTVLKKPDWARKEMDEALRIPAQAAEAARLAAGQPGGGHFHVYDFSKWQHQGDWEAPSGVWSTQDGQYVLESPAGGDTYVKPEALGGPFSARHARIGFEFTPGKLGEGGYISAEFGDAGHALTLVFTATGYELQVNAAQRTLARGAWTAGPTAVALAIDDDRLTVTLNGAPCEPLLAPGVSDLKGTLSLHVREATCAFDNIVLRNAE